MKGAKIMRRSDLITGILFSTIGIVFFAMACTDIPLQSLFCGLAGAGIGPGVMMISKYVYWSHPDRKTKYTDKLEAEKIKMHDEREEMLRGKTACFLHAYTLVVIGIYCIIFQVLEKLMIIENSRVFIIYLGILFFSEILLYRWIFKQYEKKY